MFDFSWLPTSPVQQRRAWRSIALVAMFGAACWLSLQVAARLDALMLATDAVRIDRIDGSVLASDDFNDSIRSQSFWRSGSSSGASERRSSNPPVRAIATPQAPAPVSRPVAQPKPAPAPQVSEQAKPTEKREKAESSDDDDKPEPKSRSSRPRTYRTVCVRLCDGSFFPINYSTPRDDLEDDAATCERSCIQPARLFFHRTTGEDMSDLVDLKGQPYAKLPTANLFRTAFDPACRCRPNAWEQAERDRHRVYALEIERKKGNKGVVAEIAELKTKVVQHTQFRKSEAKTKYEGVIAEQKMAQKLARQDKARGGKSARKDVEMASTAATAGQTFVTATLGQPHSGAEPVLGEPRQTASPDPDSTALLAQEAARSLRYSPTPAAIWAQVARASVPARQETRLVSLPKKAAPARSLPADQPLSGVGLQLVSAALRPYPWVARVFSQN